jgi:hypothetical protein
MIIANNTCQISCSQGISKSEQWFSRGKMENKMLWGRMVAIPSKSGQWFRVSRLKKYDRKIKKQIGEIQNSINKGQK